MKTIISSILLLLLIHVMSVFAQSSPEWGLEDWKIGHDVVPLIRSKRQATVCNEIFAGEEFSARPNNMSHGCWKMYALPKSAVVLEFTYLNLDSANPCNRVRIYDGDIEDESKLLRRVCGDQLPSQIMTTGNMMLVVYDFEGLDPSSGFNATSFPDENECLTNNGGCKDICMNSIGSFKCSCQSDMILHQDKRSCTCENVITGTNRTVITTPNYPDNYPGHISTCWLIPANSTQTIILNFTDFDLAPSFLGDFCKYDYVSIFNGLSKDSHLLGKHCGQQLRKPSRVSFTSRGRLLTFKSDFPQQHRGFRAEVIIDENECLTNNGGCQGVCHNDIGSYSCSCREGLTLADNGRDCLCENILTDMKGEFTSPNYPNPYNGTSYVCWKIIADPGYNIFLNTTDIVSSYYQSKCDFDTSVFLHDVQGIQYYPQNVMCSHENVMSESGTIFVIKNPSTTSQTGFKAQYDIDFNECAVNNGGCEHSCTNTLGSYKCSCPEGMVLDEDQHSCICQRIITAENGEIVSPNYPDGFPRYSQICWHITTNPGHKILLEFTDFDMPSSSWKKKCPFGHVSIKDGDISTKLCGRQLPDPIISQGNNITVIMKTRNQVHSGFKGNHSTEINECEENNGGCQQFCTNTIGSFQCSCHPGFVLQEDDRSCICQNQITEDGQVISTPNYPNDYNNKKFICWEISGNPGHKIHLNFTAFDLEPFNGAGKPCGYDYVTIHDGRSVTDNAILEKSCGNQLPGPVQSTNNTMLVLFKSDQSEQMPGFEAYIKHFE